MVRLTWTDQSISDLVSIAEFISRDSVRYASLTVKNIRDKAQILKTNPLAGRVVPEINDPDIRELIMGNYRIIYSVIAKTQIDILTVHHSARLL
jgi:addiction module RelE/StbE family toxin